MTLNMRAWSYYEKDQYYKSDDYIAPLVIPYFFKLLAKFNIMGTLFKKFAPKGIYEYCIARTKLIDSIFKNYSEHIQQVLIFGAGFDSRAIRFRKELHNTKLFELDAPMTQQNKINTFKEKNIDLPANLNFISIDFNKESLIEKLDSFGFKRDMRSLFVLEGITMYLTEESAESTFNTISQYAGSGSIIVFDYVYASVINRKNSYDDEEKLYEFVEKKGEKFTFGFEKTSLINFLKKHDLELLDEYDSDKLQERFFTDKTGKSIAPVNEIHCIVVAKKK